MATARFKSHLELFIPLILLIGGFFLFFARQEVPNNTPVKSAAESVEPVDQELSGELTVFKPDQASPGFTLYSVIGKAKVFLLSLEGKIVHEWDIDAQRARLLKNGNLLVVHGSKWGTRVEPWKGLKFTVREYAWNGSLVWEYRSPYRIHHDVHRLSNGNTLFPVRRNLEPPYLDLVTHPQRERLEQIRTDSVIEVNMEGQIVWSWKAEDFLDVNQCGKAGCENENPADWTHLNTVSPLPPNKWFSMGDKRFKPGNILSVLRNWWEMKLIDKESKEIVWDYSGDYRGGLSGGHDAYMIEENLPGAGNILIFDNGRYAHQGESIILEIEPPTKKVVWTYENGKDFFSNSAGSVQRLPNGNTFISDDLSGRAFEVTPDKEIVWEYRGNYRTARFSSISSRFQPSSTKY